MNLSDLKNIVQSIANKKGLQVTFVHPDYSSQCCMECGHIARENRITQEEFLCVRCGNSRSADAYSAEKLEDRVGSDVLRENLLVDNDGIYTPKKLTMSFIKSFLSEYYDSNARKETGENEAEKGCYLSGFG